MSGLHLSHKISWIEVTKFFTITKDPGVELPVCKCQKIHIIDKETKIRVENRKNYLSNLVCDIESHEIIGKKKFYKNTKGTIDLKKRIKYHSYEEPLDHIKFIKQLTEAIIEFAETESTKYKRNIYVKNNNNEKVNHLNEKDYIHSIIEQLKEKYDWFKPDKVILFNTCLCWLFYVLVEVGDVDTLLSFTDDQIKSVFNCYYSGQAIGNHTNFFIHHIIETYILTNLIYAADFVNNCEKWGPMAPNQYFRSNLMMNCDGQTFLYQSRKYLADDIYMKDLKATKQLCKDCFRFIYILCMVRMQIYGKEETENWIKYQIFFTL